MGNYIYPSSYTNSTKKEISSNFATKINREPKDKKFANKLSKYLTKHLISFFNYKEMYELGKTNVFFMNNVIEYIEENEPWPEKIRKLKSKYNFQIYTGEVDLSLKEAKLNERRYKFPKREEDKGENYFQYHKDGNRYLAIGNTFKWAHQDNISYWQGIKIDGSYIENSVVYYLTTVCWIDISLYFYHVKPNNYKVFINEFFVSHKRFINKLDLTIKLGQNKEIYKTDFPSNQIFKANNGSKDNARLNEDFICYIKKEDFDNVEKDINDDCIVEIKFFAKDNFWKGGWFFDGGSLTEISKKDLEREEEIKKKNEEEKQYNLRRFESKEEENNKK